MLSRDDGGKRTRAYFVCAVNNCPEMALITKQILRKLLTKQVRIFDSLLGILIKSN